MTKSDFAILFIDNLEYDLRSELRNRLNEVPYIQVIISINAVHRMLDVLVADIRTDMKISFGDWCRDVKTALDKL